jgi:hypothetical protein
MADKAEKERLENRQARVAKATWGLTFMVMGGLFFLAELGTIDMGDRRGYRAAFAVDGNPRTRWSSAFADPQWISVDLGSKADITRLRLRWEEAFAKAYAIQVSDDAESWTTVKEVTEGQGGVEEHEVSASGRYVRLLGSRRSTAYGYSLWELEVYGRSGRPGPGPWTSDMAPVLLSQGMEARSSSREGASYFGLYWPVLLLAAGLPALIAPKDGGDQLFGLFLVGAGSFLQLQRLALVDWSLAQAWPLLLVAGGLLLVVQAVRQIGREAPADAAAGGGDRGPIVR